ncbi:M48 family metallopeptidase [Methanobacterium oryzae]|uniref:M48 family metallopeptidase n=1 Tax=Methanobacterium oryzae TaxID=69540 RepID=UPI003D1C3B93
MIDNPKAQTFFIDTEISENYQEDILEFIIQNYLKIRPEYFENIEKTTINDFDELSFVVKDPVRLFRVKAKIKSLNPLEITLLPDENASPELTESIKQDLFFIIHAFEENILSSTLYFSWVEGEDIIPEKPPKTRKKVGDRLFTSSGLILTYVLFFGFNIILYLFIGIYAVFVILGTMFLIVLFSNKLLSARSNWKITPENPYVHILEYQLPFEEFKEFQEKFGKETVIQIKKEIYDRTFARKTEPNCKIGDEVLKKYGFYCNPRSNISKVVNVYDIVKKAADSFNLPTPKIVISNTMVPNAAATGPSPSRGLVLITTGLLVHLNEEEILSVIGHEMGHLQGRDPLILFGIIAGEFIFRLTVIAPNIPVNPFLYLIFIFAVIFFIAKFFETRADLLSAMKIGKPRVLAEALKKIAYKRLQMERISRSKIPGWLAFDPHPPIYFRIDRLERMETPVNVKNPLIQSAKDVFNGFISSFK